MALRTSLYDWHLKNGAVMVEFGGWDMPIRYGSISEEHLRVRTSCGMFDVSHMGRLSFSGNGSFDLIQKIWTNDASTMKDMQVRYGLLCQENGGIIDDVLVYKWPYGWAMVVNASNRQKVISWINRNRVGIEVDLEDQTVRTSMIAVQGPDSLAKCRGLFPFELEKIGYYHALPTVYSGKPCVVSRTGYTGEDGIEIIVPGELGPCLAEDLRARGILPCGLGARDTLRLEAAMPLYGHELSEEIDPIQAGLGWAVKLNKGSFLGKKGIELRQKNQDRKVRVGLEVEGRRAARENAIIKKENREIGRVTSGTLTPFFNKPIAMGYLDQVFSEPGTELLVEIGKSEAKARVVPLPFYRRIKS